MYLRTRDPLVECVVDLHLEGDSNWLRTEMTSIAQLSAGSISAIYNFEECIGPVVQIIGIKRIRSARHR